MYRLRLEPFEDHPQIEGERLILDEEDLDAKLYHAIGGQPLKRRRLNIMISKIPFGHTGHSSTRVIFGAAAFSAVTQAEADDTMELLLKYGINHIDTAAAYGDSEMRLGPWTERCRGEFFLATKTEQRTYAKAKEQIHRSLERLRVDQLDLVQLHALIEPEEWQIAMGPGGALEAVMEAREQGLVRFVGVTGHGVTIAKRHQESLQRFPFDSVLLPYSYPQMQNPEYAADFAVLQKLCEERGVAMQTIKAIACRNWIGDERRAATWYEPLQDPAEIEKAVHWVLGKPGIFLNSCGDIHLLPHVLEAASREGVRPSDAEMQALVEAREMQPLFV